ncbi:MAG TPA: hypothetical protein VJ912_02350 [Candidatus Nanoarchaeia archaeon]|nr:hypothetical protein [Candidatus Nanoarchaeia archaeon]
MNKRGQFYLMVSAVIIAVMVGFLSTQNFVIEKSSVDFSHLEEEMQIESEKIMDYALYNDDYSILDDFTREYSEYLNNKADVIYIVNSSGKLDVYKYDEDLNRQNIENYYNLEDKVIVPFYSNNYTFNLNKGEDFYFILTKEEKGERYVITNKI